MPHQHGAARCARRCVVKPRTSWNRIVTSRRSPLERQRRRSSTAAATSRETKRPKVSLMRSRSSRPATISLNERARKPISSSRCTLRRWREVAGEHAAHGARPASAAARRCRRRSAADQQRRRAAPRRRSAPRAAAERRAGRARGRTTPAPAQTAARGSCRLDRDEHREQTLAAQRSTRKVERSPVVAGRRRARASPRRRPSGKSDARCARRPRRGEQRGPR